MLLEVLLMPDHQSRLEYAACDSFNYFHAGHHYRMMQRTKSACCGQSYIRMF